MKKPALICSILLFGFLLLLALPARCLELLDDRAIQIHSARDVSAKRGTLIKYLWGNEGFPLRLPTAVLTNVATPVHQLSHLARVDEFRVDLGPGLQGLAYHFIAEKPNHQLVVVHHGHACSFDDNPSPKDAGYGMQRTIHALLREGYGVLAVFMPHMRPDDCTGHHDDMFNLTVTNGSPIKLFLETTALSLNYLEHKSRSGNFPKYRVFHMTGLSGGGWSTTIYSAVDPRIRCSFPVAGSIPLYLRSHGSIGDREQFEKTFYEIASYPDLYILGAAEKGRKQVQILNRRDNCCFGEAQHDAKAMGKTYDESMREYEKRVQTTLAKIGQSSFRLEIDETAPGHMISNHAINDVILPELRSSR